MYITDEKHLNYSHLAEMLKFQMASRGIENLIACLPTWELLRHFVDDNFSIVWIAPENLSPAEKEEAEKAGIKVVACRKGPLCNSPVFREEMLANTFKLLGEGEKISISCAIEALERNLVAPGEEVMALSADTAIALVPSYRHNLLNTKIVDVIYRPYL